VLSDLSFRYVETPMRRNGIRPTTRAWWAGLSAQLRQHRASPATVGAVGFTAVTLVAVGVLLVGPSAPTPASASSGPGGRSLVVTPQPTSTTPATLGRTPPSSDELPAVSGYGDSVLLDARHALGKVFDGGTIDAIIGRQPDPILADIRTAARAHALNPVVIIHIGDNGLIRAADLEHTLRLLQDPQTGARVVLVVNDHIDPYDNSWQKPNNKLIAKVVPRFHNARIVPWDRLAGAHHGWLYPDDLHLRPQGTIAYARILAAAYRVAARELSGRSAT
jgi:hypothetical protein